MNYGLTWALPSLGCSLPLVALGHAEWSIGALLGRSDALDQWFWPWVNTFLNMPALVVIVICYLALGMTELAAVLAVVVNKTPLIAVNVRDGVRQFEPRYDEFASIYRLSWIQKGSFDLDSPT